MTTNKFKKAMTLSVVPAVSLGLLAIPANAQEETDAVKETAENTINLKVSGIDRDREANVQLLNSEDKVIAEQTVNRNGARVSFDYNAEDIQDGILTVAVDGETYTTIGAKCTAQSGNDTDSEEPTPTEDQDNAPTTDAPTEAPTEAPAPTEDGTSTDTDTDTDVDSTTDDTSGNGGLLDRLDGLGDIGGLLNGALSNLGGSEGLSNIINDGIQNIIGDGTIDPGRILDIVSQGAGALPQSVEGNVDEDYAKAIELAANDKNTALTDKEAKDLNLEGTEKETAEAFAELGKVYAKGLEEYAGKNPTDVQVKEYSQEFTNALVQELESDPYALEDLKSSLGGVLDGPLGDVAISAGAAFADTIAPGIGGIAVRTVGNTLKDILSSRLQDQGTDTEGTEDTTTGTDTTGTDTNIDAPVETAQPATGNDVEESDTETTDPVETENAEKSVELELEVGEYTIDILNANEANLIDCSVELLADEFDDDDVFDQIPTPVDNAQVNENKEPLQPAPRAVTPASAEGAYGPKVDTGGHVETSFITTLIGYFTK